MRNKCAFPPDTKYLSVIFMSLSLVSLSGPSFSQEMSDVADGKTWEMKNVNGRTGQLKLNPDGSGEMRMSLVRMNVSWKGEGNQICINAPVRGEQCVELQANGTGFIGVQGSKQVFTLSRSEDG